MICDEGPIIVNRFQQDPRNMRRRPISPSNLLKPFRRRRHATKTANALHSKTCFMIKTSDAA
jgi:hypothetical protein